MKWSDLQNYKRVMLHGVTTEKRNAIMQYIVDVFRFNQFDIILNRYSADAQTMDLFIPAQILSGFLETFEVTT